MNLSFTNDVYYNILHACHCLYSTYSNLTILKEIDYVSPLLCHLDTVHIFSL